MDEEEVHPYDDSESCDWCGNFVCCMKQDDIVRERGKLFCNKDCANAEIDDQLHMAP
jgi:hypothetical protein